MPGAKKIRVREARTRDVGLFRKLWGDFLKVQNEKGAKVIGSDRTLRFFEKLFEIYVIGAYDGTVLLVADKGILMWGDAGSPVEYQDGKTAMGWGVHVVDAENEAEIREALERRASQILREKGFDGVTGTVFASEVDDVGVEWEHVSLNIYRKLEES